MKAKELVLLLVCIALLLSAKATGSAKLHNSFTGLTYSTVSMRSSQTITILDGIYRRYSNGEKVVGHRLAKSELSMLYQLVGSIDLSKINDLEVPSRRHRFDGAMLAVIEVQIGQEVYVSVPFDHDNPPSQLKPLVDQLLSRHL
jgi:hypothetical protein